ncbi:cysteine--tRNA ligase [Salinarimonas soli]|uniref:Cysteine--tRNA ligase n=1 Tax=Salinarimonas soli TaxID=1638099 RepID=A0A5B2VFQ2_9HYPH|nr:cysteine--tRNA ligase [Salinarimonas soli]KAA2237458.1 cysteine--tRNA ligase [Salinarimonas soli]
MALRLYNTMTRTKDAFVPIDPARVRVYACGPTVYDFAHIGNARPVIVFDVLFRLLRHLYGTDHVTYVRNITDVDDKINARAAERGVSIREVTEGTARQFRDDVAALGCLPPTVEPRATDHIAEMRDIIDRLVASGHAYVAEEHVLFHVPSMPDYGALSRRPLDEMEAGARVDVAPYKRSPLDFVLWKPSPPDWPAWPSPAGIATPGRPGWHIECSAMAWRHLGEVFDIHAGGVDLTFPHHENEIAQSRCCFGTDVMANVWMHNGFLQVEGQKMSKSLGNFLTIRELLADWPGEVLRLAMLRTQYRQPIDWTLRSLEESARVLERWYGAAGRDAGDPAPAVLEALFDDLNTPLVLSELHRQEGAALAGSLALLGFSLDPAALTRPGAAEVDAAVVEALLARRREARAAKNWAESDRLRDEVVALGVVIKDNKDGTTSWEVAR